MENQNKHLVAVIGAGPAGLFAAKELANHGVQVALFNRDIKPGGLAEYGIYPDKLKMKEGLRAQFRQVLALPNVHYFGNVLVGRDGDISLDEIQAMGFQAVLVTAGAQGTKWLGLHGEELHGVYHAKDIVYHYNQLPPFSQKDYRIGKRVAVVGMGNVMIDITHFLIAEKHVEEVIAIARRGPGEIKFDKKEFETVAANFDAERFDREVDQVKDLMIDLGQNPEEPKAFIHSTIAKAPPAVYPTLFHILFLASPVEILGNEQGEVTGLVVERNTLQENKGNIRAVGLGQYETLDVDTVIFAIGDRVDDHIGLPVFGTEFLKSKQPEYPVEGVCYEACHDGGECAGMGLFVAGWSRQASTGLVGIARKDGTNGARAVLQFLDTKPEMETDQPIVELKKHLAASGKPVINAEDIACLEKAERERGVELQVEGFKYGSNEQMLMAMGYLK